MVKYNGTTFKNEGNFVNVRSQKTFGYYGGPDVYQHCYFQNILVIEVMMMTTPVLGSYYGIYAKLHNTLRLNYEVKSKSKTLHRTE